ncbi:hypothetical protein VNO77_20196 [Canavalia gladiata]|uniref:Uncharacterized protein n=1 Tax=Canavalia gladiata TaxID=3824 RepID=A0AAN9LP35_CANGL
MNWSKEKQPLVYSFCLIPITYGILGSYHKWAPYYTKRLEVILRELRLCGHPRTRITHGIATLLPSRPWSSSRNALTLILFYVGLFSLIAWPPSLPYDHIVLYPSEPRAKLSPPPHCSARLG